MAEVHPEVASEVEPSTNVARAVWGLLLIWTGAAVFFRWGWGVGAVGAGALLVLCGAGSLFQVAIDLFPLVIIAAGIVLLVSTWSSRARHAQGGPSELHAPSHPRL